MEKPAEGIGCERHKWPTLYRRSRVKALLVFSLEHECGPVIVLGPQRIIQHFELGFTQSSARTFTLLNSRVKARHELRSRSVVHLPQAGNHALRTSIKKSTGEP